MTTPLEQAQAFVELALAARKVATALDSDGICGSYLASDPTVELLCELIPEVRALTASMSRSTKIKALSSYYRRIADEAQAAAATLARQELI